MNGLFKFLCSSPKLPISFIIFDDIIKTLDDKINHIEHILRYIDKRTYTDLYNSSGKLFSDILNFRSDLWKLCEEIKNIEWDALAELREWAGLIHPDGVLPF